MTDQERLELEEAAMAARHLHRVMEAGRLAALVNDPDKLARNLDRARAELRVLVDFLEPSADDT